MWMVSFFVTVSILIALISIFSRLFQPRESIRGHSPRRKRKRRHSSPKKQFRKRTKGTVTPLYHPFVELDYSVFYKPLPFPRLPPEVETDNREYKLKLDPLREERFQQLVTQMKYRVANGNGKAFYEIGVRDDGSPIGIKKEVFIKSLQILSSMAKKLDGTVQIVKVRDGSTPHTLAAEVIIHIVSMGKEAGNEVRIAICGNMDDGKSTLLGVLSSGELDNGRGKARMNIFRHKHELENGHTSDIGREILGFDKDRNIVNYSMISAPTWSQIIENSTKVISFMDLAGDKKYFKTTITGMIGNFPDYAMLVVGGKVGTIGSITKEHFALTQALNVPTLIVVTKIDICSEKELGDTLSSLYALLKSPGSGRTPFLIQSEEDAVTAATSFRTSTNTPIFCVSNVTGSHLDFVRLFLSFMEPTKDWNVEKEKNPLLYVDDTFSVTEVGTVISGTLLQGQISLGEELQLGPDQDNKFINVTINSIHSNRLPVQKAVAGQSICLALHNIARDTCRKGQALCSYMIHPKAVWEFEASVCLVSQAAAVAEKYEAVIHCGCAQQTAILAEIENDQDLHAGVLTRVRFRFKYHSEFLRPGDRFIFREGSSGGVGTALQILEPMSPKLFPRDAAPNDLSPLESTFVL